MPIVALRRRMTNAADDAAVLDRELGALRANIAARRAEADQLERDSGRIPELEATAKAAALRAPGAPPAGSRGIGGAAGAGSRGRGQCDDHRGVISRGGGARRGRRRRQHPQAVYGGLVLPDLVAAFVGEQQQIWAAAWAPPIPPPVPVPSKPLRPGEPPPPSGVQYQGLALPSSGPVLEPHQFPPTVISPEAARRREHAKPPPPATSLVPPLRTPRNDPEPAADSGARLINILRGSVALDDGRLCGIGDRVAVALAEAERLVLRGAADFVRS
jgi:hypothetical protein